MNKKVLLIGGGTGGHIFPLRNLADELLSKGASVTLIVSDSALDRKIVAENFSDLPVHFFRTGKIRRYLSWKNIRDVFRIIGSCWTARTLLKEIRPDVIFFKGGFVGFPFLIAVKLLRCTSAKIFSHESDISVGVMTKLASRFATQTFHSFGPKPMPLFYSPTSTNQVENRKSKIENDSSFVIRNSSLTPPTPPLLSRAGSESVSGNKILVFGGSQGAQFLNEMTMKCHDKLLTKYKVTLVTGVGKKTNTCHDNLSEYEFLPTGELSQKMRESNLVIARGGANSLFEIVSSHTPSIIIPLPSVARDHQRLNTLFFSQKNLCVLLEEKDTNPKTFLETIEKALQDETMRKALSKSDIENKAKSIAEILVS